MANLIAVSLENFLKESKWHCFSEGISWLIKATKFNALNAQVGDQPL